jgi:Secretion system C-terminal sorting domain
MKKFYIVFLILLSTKLLAQPACQWAYIPIGTSAYHNITNSSIDANGSIVQTGRITGIADMDPGTGSTDTAFSYIGYNYYVSKINSNGHLIWIKYFQLNGLATMFDFMGLQVNSNNEIIVVGNFFGSVDFDLSATGVDTLRSHFPTYPDYFVAKYDSSGNYLWAFNIGNPTTSNIEVQSVTIQPNNDIVITANPNGTVDVDPSATVHNSIGGNANIICYDSNGNYLWNSNISTQYSYANNYKSLDGDAVGNNYLLTVGYYELTVNKFDNTGARLWDKTLGDFSSGSRVTPQSVLVDKSNGDFYIAGTFDNTVDFDPGSGVTNLISNNISYQDGFIARYDSSMNLIWVNYYAGNISFGDYSLDFSGNDIIAAGNLKGTINFGNGITFSSPTQSTPFYIKFDNSGTVLNGYMLNGFGSYNTINATGNQSFVASGYVGGTIDMDPTSGTVTLSATNAGGFNAVYGTVPTAITEINKNNSLSVFPNPATNFLVVETKANSIAKLFDINGREIFSQNINANSKNSLDVSEIANGLYLLNVGNDFQKVSINH